MSKKEDGIKVPYSQSLIIEIKEVHYPMRLIPELLERNLVFEKPGPGLLMIWNDEKLNQMTNKELLELLMGLNFESSTGNQPSGKDGLHQKKGIFEGDKYFN